MYKSRSAVDRLGIIFRYRLTDDDDESTKNPIRIIQTILSCICCTIVLVVMGREQNVQTPLMVILTAICLTSMFLTVADCIAQCNMSPVPWNVWLAACTVCTGAFFLCIGLTVCMAKSLGRMFTNGAVASFVVTGLSFFFDALFLMCKAKRNDISVLGRAVSLRNLYVQRYSDRGDGGERQAEIYRSELLQGARSVVLLGSRAAASLNQANPSEPRNQQRQQQLHQQRSAGAPYGHAEPIEMKDEDKTSQEEEEVSLLQATKVSKAVGSQDEDSQQATTPSKRPNKYTWALTGKTLQRPITSYGGTFHMSRDMAPLPSPNILEEKRFNKSSSIRGSKSLETSPRPSENAEEMSMVVKPHSAVPITMAQRPQSQMAEKVMSALQQRKFNEDGHYLLPGQTMFCNIAQTSNTNQEGTGRNIYTEYANSPSNIPSVPIQSAIQFQQDFSQPIPDQKEMSSFHAFSATLQQVPTVYATCQTSTTDSPSASPSQMNRKSPRFHQNSNAVKSLLMQTSPSSVDVSRQEQSNMPMGEMFSQTSATSQSVQPSSSSSVCICGKVHYEPLGLNKGSEKCGANCSYSPPSGAATQINPNEYNAAQEKQVQIQQQHHFQISQQHQQQCQISQQTPQLPSQQQYQLSQQQKQEQQSPYMQQHKQPQSQPPQQQFHQSPMAQQQPKQLLLQREYQPQQLQLHELPQKQQQFQELRQQLLQQQRQQKLQQTYTQHEQNQQEQQMQHQKQKNHKQFQPKSPPISPRRANGLDDEDNRPTSPTKILYSDSETTGSSSKKHSSIGSGSLQTISEEPTKGPSEELLEWSKQYNETERKSPRLQVSFAQPPQTVRKFSFTSGTKFEPTGKSPFVAKETLVNPTPPANPPPPYRSSFANVPDTGLMQRAGIFLTEAQSERLNNKPNQTILKTVDDSSHMSADYSSQAFPRPVKGASEYNYANPYQAEETAAKPVSTALVSKEDPTTVS